jgi:hypothetical protein
MSNSLPHVREIRASLKKHAPYLQDSVHAEIAKGMLDDGLARDGDGHQISARAANKTVPLVAPGLPKGFVKLRTAMQAAADPQNLPLLKQAVATAQRLGFEIKPDETINTFELDRALAGKDLDERWALKTILHRLAMI